MKKFYIIFIMLVLNGCNSHPRDRTHMDDIIHCGFGQEYVSGYTKKDGTKVAGYCRKQN